MTTFVQFQFIPMRKTICIFIAVLTALCLCQNANAQLSRLKFSKYKITGISIQSMRSVNGSLEICCRNDSTGFVMSDISGTVYKKGRAFVKGYTSPVRVSSGSSNLKISGNASLYDGISLWDVLSCVAFNPDDYTIDVKMKVVNDKGATRIVDKRGIRVGSLLKRL